MEPRLVEDYCCNTSTYTAVRLAGEASGALESSRHHDMSSPKDPRRACSSSRYGIHHVQVYIISLSMLPLHLLHFFHKLSLI